MTGSSQGHVVTINPVNPDDLAGPREEVLIFGGEQHFTGQHISRVLDCITANEAFKTVVQEEIAGRGQSFASYGEFLSFLRALIHGLVREDAGTLGFDAFEMHEALASYRESVEQSIDTYRCDVKPNPHGVFWPNPTRHPESSVFKTLPFIENLGLITRETPIGSAGSCFAIELARSLQKRGFNYVRTESEHEDTANGVFVDHYDPDDTQASFSATYGLLFNTPSFRQLAEKAFGGAQLAAHPDPTATDDAGRAGDLSLHGSLP